MADDGAPSSIPYALRSSPLKTRPTPIPASPTKRLPASPRKRLFPDEPAGPSLLQDPVAPPTTDAHPTQIEANDKVPRVQRVSSLAILPPPLPPRLAPSAASTAQLPRAGLSSYSSSSTLGRTRSAACLPVVPLLGGSQSAVRPSTIAAAVDTTKEEGRARKDIAPLTPTRRSSTRLRSASPSVGDRKSQTELAPTTNALITVPRQSGSLPPPRPSGLATSTKGRLSRCSSSLRLPTTRDLATSERVDWRIPEEEEASTSTSVVSTCSVLVSVTSSQPSISSLSNSSHLTLPPPSPGRSRTRVLAPSPSASSIRLRPPSPSRFAKTNSGLLRSYASVAGLTSSSTIPPSLPPRPSSTVVVQRSTASARTLVLQSPQVADPFAFTEYTPEAPRPFKRRLVSQSSEEGERMEWSNDDRTGREAVVKQPSGDMEGVRESDKPLPPSSFLLRDTTDDMQKARVYGMSTDAAPSYGKKGTPQLVRNPRNGHIPIVDDGTPTAPCSSSTTSRVTVRRSKKMRRLEMDSGEVDEEARELEFDADVTLPYMTTPQVAEDRLEDADRACSSLPPPVAGCSTSAADAAAASPLPLLTPLRPVPLPPPPEKSALRRTTTATQEATPNPPDVTLEKRRVQFTHVDVYSFGRQQAFSSVPSEGEVCIGMDTVHHDEERYMLDGVMDGESVSEEMSMDEEEDLSEGEIRPLVSPRLQPYSSPRHPPLGNRDTTRRIAPLSSKQRCKLLRLNGIKIYRDPCLSKEHQELRERRKACGCSCMGGHCRPETCECARDGIACQVDTEDNTFPCRCSVNSCKNPSGRVHFDASRVKFHHIITLKRVKDIERLSPEARGSPTLTKFPDDDDDADGSDALRVSSHCATSYLDTPPPAVYSSSQKVVLAVAESFAQMNGTTGCSHSKMDEEVQRSFTPDDSRFSPDDSMAAYVTPDGGSSPAAAVSLSQSFREPTVCFGDPNLEQEEQPSPRKFPYCPSLSS